MKDNYSIAFSQLKSQTGELESAFHINTELEFVQNQGLTLELVLVPPSYFLLDAL